MLTVPHYVIWQIANETGKPPLKNIGYCDK